MQTAQDILSQIVWREETAQTGNSLGTLKQAFPDAQILIVKRSKTGAKRATIMVKTAKGITNVICSEPLTPLVRDGRVTEEHLAGFPLIWNAEQKAMYIGFPAQGWIEVKTITAKEFVPQAVSHQDIIA